MRTSLCLQPQVIYREKHHLQWLNYFIKFHSIFLSRQHNFQVIHYFKHGKLLLLSFFLMSIYILHRASSCAPTDPFMTTLTVDLPGKLIAHCATEHCQIKEERKTKNKKRVEENCQHKGMHVFLS